MDGEAIESAGAQPLSELFAAVDEVTEIPALIELMGSLARKVFAAWSAWTPSPTPATRTGT